jgi:hypothetical protein
MQYISFNSKTIVPTGTANRLPLEAAVENWAEETDPAGVLPVGFYQEMNAHDREFPVVCMEPIEEYSEVDPKPAAWKVVTAWTAAAVGSWALVIGFVMIARALLP